MGQIDKKAKHIDKLAEQMLQEELEREGRIANAKLMRAKKREDIEALGLDPNNPEPKKESWEDR